MTALALVVMLAQAGPATAQPGTPAPDPGAPAAAPAGAGTAAATGEPDPRTARTMLPVPSRRPMPSKMPSMIAVCV